MKKAIIRLSSLVLLMVCAIPWGVMSAPPSQDALLETMQLELKRATTLLAKSSPAPYYLSYAVTDASASAIVATDGAIANSTAVHRRQADVMMRGRRGNSTIRMARAVRPESHPDRWLSVTTKTRLRAFSGSLPTANTSKHPPRS